jgi:L-rhamnose isomerase
MGVRMITINFDKAKDITKDRLRTERKPMLESLDVVQLRNLNNPVVLATIEAKKQALRDATSQVDTMTTLDELKAASLPVLE